MLMSPCPGCCCCSRCWSCSSPAPAARTCQEISPSSLSLLLGGEREAASNPPPPRIEVRVDDDDDDDDDDAALAAIGDWFACGGVGEKRMPRAIRSLSLIEPSRDEEEGEGEGCSASARLPAGDAADESLLLDRGVVPLLGMCILPNPPPRHSHSLSSSLLLSQVPLAGIHRSVSCFGLVLQPPPLRLLRGC
jgi:hypothetical protein